MALPINNSPIYTLQIPSTGKKVKYRPFLVKEEKALLIAQQAEDMGILIETLKSVIASCIQDELDVNTLATFDFEYIFTQLRAKSVGEIIELKLKCDTCTDEKAVATVFIDLTKLKVEKNKDHTNKIPLFDDVGIVMNYPTTEIVKKVQDELDQTNIDQMFDIIVDSVNYIYTNDEVFYSKDQTKEELLEFLNNLNSEQFGKIQKFFETLPKLSHDITYTCPVCSKKHEKTLEGLNSFF